MENMGMKEYVLPDGRKVVSAPAVERGLCTGCALLQEEDCTPLMTSKVLPECFNGYTLSNIIFLEKQE